MAFNADLARKVLAYIREHPEQHNQTNYVEPAEEHWWDPEDDEPYPDVLALAEGVKPKDGEYRCMTTACIAGWSAVLAGPQAVREAVEKIDMADLDDQWFQAGMHLLGLTRPQAEDVFLDMDEEHALRTLEYMIETAGNTT